MVVRVIAIVAILAGCGDEAEPELDPFATLRVRTSSTLVHGHVRLATVWTDHGVDGAQAQPTESERVPTGERVALSLRHVPDADAFREWTPVDGAVASAGLVAFIDRNGNDIFDLTAASEPDFRDDVVGWVPGIRLTLVPEPSFGSSYAPGLNIERHVTLDAFETYSELLPLDRELTVQLFDAPEASCFGLSPVPGAMPAALREIMNGLDPRPARTWPYGVGLPPCPDNALPADWYRVSCAGGPGRYDVQMLDWPWDDDIAELCGWVTHYCRVELPAGAPPPPEFPTCE